MDNVLVDTSELTLLSREFLVHGVEVEALANRTSGLLTAVGGDPELASVRERIWGAVTGIRGVGLDLQRLSGVMSAQVFDAIVAGGLAGQFGSTTNPLLNQLLGSAAGAQGVLAGTGVLPWAVGGDLNSQALAISASVGVAHALKGTGPLYANGAIAGMHNSLGIAFPASGGSTVGWALGLVEHQRARLASGDHTVPTSSSIRANPFFHQATGSVGQPLTHPII